MWYKGKVIALLSHLSPTPWKHIGSGGIAPPLLTSVLDGGWVVSLTPLPLYLWGNSPRIHCIGGSESPRAGLDAVERRKMSCPYQESIPDYTIVQPSLVAILAELSRLPLIHIVHESVTHKNCYSNGSCLRRAPLLRRREGLPGGLEAVRKNVIFCCQIQLKSLILAPFNHLFRTHRSEMLIQIFKK
jgi:hypothetical protein